jgi:hypothetical protein
MDLYTRSGRGASPRLDQLEDPNYLKSFAPWEKPAIFLESVKLARTDVAVAQSEATTIFDREMDLAYLGKKSVIDALRGQGGDRSAAGGRRALRLASPLAGERS